MLPVAAPMRGPMAKAQTAFAIAQAGLLPGWIAEAPIERRYPAVVDLRGPQGQTRRFIYPSCLYSFGLLAALFIPAQGLGWRRKLIHCAAGSGLLLVAAFGEFYLAWGGAAAEWLLPPGPVQSLAVGWARLLSGFNLQFGPFVLPLAYWMAASPFAWNLAAVERPASR